MRSPSLEKVQGHRRPNSHGFHGVVPKNRCHRRTGEAGRWHCWGISERIKTRHDFWLPWRLTVFLQIVTSSISFRSSAILYVSKFLDTQQETGRRVFGGKKHRRKITECQ